MKKTVLILALLLVFSTISWAEVTGDQKSTQQQKMMPCPMMKMHGQEMQMCPMMKHHGMMMDDMMQMMKNIMKMQERIITGVKGDERKNLLKEISVMIDKMDKMMANMHGMMKMQGMTGMPPAVPPKSDEKKDEPQKEEQKPAEHKH